MSPDRNQRKQELLIRLSCTRLGIIDEAETLVANLKNNLGWLSPVKKIIGKTATGKNALVALLLGILLAGGIGKLITRPLMKAETGAATGSIAPTLGRMIATTIWSIIVAGITPALKQNIQQTVNRKISGFVGKYLGK